MKDSFSWLTPKQAGQLAGYTARYIQALIAKGKLSATREDGKYFIEKSEFFRVFPDAKRKEREGNIALRESERERLELENGLLKEMTSKKDKEIEFLRNQVEFVSQEKVKMLDAIVSHTKLLEHKQEQILKKVGGKGSWKDIFKKK